MHKQVSSLLADGGSPGKLAQYTAIIAGQGLNIRAIGGTEWEGHGAVALLVDHDDDHDEVVDDLDNLLNDSDFPSTVIWAAEAILDDQSGSLAAACDAIGDLNILSILVMDTHLKRGLVSFGFATHDEADEARSRLGALALPEHGLTKAWQDHEDFDEAHSTPPPG
jgi:hypothetical protein